VAVGIKIITDTSCDLPQEVLEQYNIEMIPLKVTFANGETYLDRFEICPRTFVEKMSSSATLPKTSAPDPHTFVKYFEQGIRETGAVIFVSLSSGLSSTSQIAQMACNMMNSSKVKVFDSLTASLGTGIMAIRAAQMATRGMSLEAVLEKLAAIRATREVIFVLDTLENVVKGGRLSKFEGMAGTILNTKPILRGNQLGIPEIVEKVRGRKKAMKRLVAMVGELAGASLLQRIVGISHVNCLEDADKLAWEINSQYQQEAVLISDMSATIGTYAGEGGLMINF